MSDTTTRNQLAPVERFRHWLFARPPRAPVEQAGVASACPLACYLAANGIPAPLVTGVPLFSLINEPVVVADLPRWVQEFTLRIDEGRQDGEPSSAAEAITALIHVQVFAS